MLIFSDQTWHSLVLHKQPERIISLVPSQTELLYDLGLDKEIIGIANTYGQSNKWVCTKTSVGDAKQLKISLIHQLNPDLIIASKEENIQEQIETLAQYYPILITDVKTIESAYELIENIGKLTNRNQKAEKLISGIKTNFKNLTYKLKTRSDKPKVAYLNWYDPYIAVGEDTFIHSMIIAAGFENTFGHLSRYCRITIGQLQAANCELVFLPSELFPFTQKNVEEIEFFLPYSKIILVDSKMFSWHGSRMKYAPNYFNSLHEHLQLV